jgi:hypothetical protein
MRQTLAYLIPIYLWLPLSYRIDNSRAICLGDLGCDHLERECCVLKVAA